MIAYGNDFNPWYYKFKVNVITNLDDKLIVIEKDIRAEELEFYNNNEISNKRIKKIYAKLQEGEDLPF